MSETKLPPVLCFTKVYAGISCSLLSKVGLESAINPEGRIKLKALWDTGATNSLIRPEIAAKLRLQSLGKVLISTPSGKNVPSRIYSVNLYLPNNAVINKMEVLEGIPNGCDMLIGMDVINLGDFAVTNYNGRTMFSFRMPSTDRIDFVRLSLSASDPARTADV